MKHAATPSPAGPSSPDPAFPPQSAEPLAEAVADFLADARLEPDQAVVRNVALLGPRSRNGYEYTTEAMQQAVPLYEGRPVFLDHPPASSAPDSVWPLQRSIRDYAGKVAHARFDDGRIRGDLELFGANTSWLLGLFEAAPTDIGMSHVVLARRNPQGDRVERIDRVLSVDIVTFPATTQSFAETTSTRNRRPSLSELYRLVEQSRIPPSARTASLFRLLEISGDVQTILSLLEDYFAETSPTSPRSLAKDWPERTDPLPRAGVPEHLRRAFTWAIRRQ